MSKLHILILILLLAIMLALPSELDGAAKAPTSEEKVEVQQVQVILSPEEMIVAEFPDAPIMLRVADAESDICTRNVNPSSSARGCFQILKGTWKDYGCAGDPLFPPDNIACARKIYDRSGLTPWNASKYDWGRFLKK